MERGIDDAKLQCKEQERQTQCHDDSCASLTTRRKAGQGPNDAGAWADLNAPQNTSPAAEMDAYQTRCTSNDMGVFDDCPVPVARVHIPNDPPSPQTPGQCPPTCDASWRNGSADVEAPRPSALARVNVYECRVERGTLAHGLCDMGLYGLPAIAAPRSAFEGECYLCSGQGHSQNFCPLSRCHACHRYGHTSRVCCFSVRPMGLFTAPLPCKTGRAKQWARGGNNDDDDDKATSWRANDQECAHTGSGKRHDTYRRSVFGSNWSAHRSTASFHS